MIRRFLSSRGTRKFLKNRLAVFCLFIIGFYAFLAALSFVGVLSLRDCDERAGPDHLPGVYGTSSFEERIEHSDFYIKLVRKHLRLDSLEKLRKECRLFEKELAPLSREEIVTKLDATDDPLDEIDELLDEYLDEEDPAKQAELSKDLEQQVEAVEAAVASLYQQPSGVAGLWSWLRLSCGTDRQGRSILFRGLYAVKVAVQIGIVVALISVLFGTLLGAAAAYFGGMVDHLVIWLYSTFSAVPSLVLLTVLVFMFTGSVVDGTLIPVYTAMCLTYWIGPCRVIRGEVLKIKELEYVQAATTVGFGRFYILRKHVIPNTVHLMFINFSLLFIGAIKSEVILTFLGLGVKNGSSWGIMINQSRQEVIGGFFWQIGTATVLMFGLVLAFNILTDALQDAFDPKHVS